MRIHCFDSQLQVAPHEISEINIVPNGLKVCGHDPTLLLNWFFLDQLLFVRMIKGKLSLKNAYMLMLLYLNEDFDDDLLLDAILLLTGK